MYYNRASEGDRPPIDYQIRDYPLYIRKARRARSRLLWCGLSLAELAHNIERIEYEIYLRKSAQEITRKEFRHNLVQERSDVLIELDAAWQEIVKRASPLEALISADSKKTALELIETRPVDSYDAFLILAAQQADVRQILSDDGDFGTITDIQFFTANHNVIESAREQGKLLNRRRTP